MYSYITAKIIDWDNFAHNPENSLLYNMKKQYPTFYGGCMTMLYYSMVGFIWYLQLAAMFYH